MSFSFTSILNFARTVITDVATDIEEIAPVAAVIPGAAPVIAAITGAATAANAAIDAGSAIVAAATPEVTQLEAWFDKLFHISVTPGVIVLTPKTSTATVPPK